ncbi:hypothetical protein ACWIGI_08335 [Nocardia sp. NPDC055321]
MDLGSAGFTSLLQAIAHLLSSGSDLSVTPGIPPVTPPPAV